MSTNFFFWGAGEQAERHKITNPPPPPSLLSAAGDVDASSVTYVNNIFYVKNDFLVQVETWTPAPSLVGAMRTFFIGYKFSQYSIYSILHSHIYIYIYIYIYMYIYICVHIDFCILIALGH